MLMLLLSACGPNRNQQDSADSSDRTRSSASASSVSTQVPDRFLRSKSPLEDASVKGITLEEAERGVGRHLPLPNDRLVGKATKTLLVGGPSDFEIGVITDLGVQIRIVPGSGEDIKLNPAGMPKNTPFTDGREHIKLVTLSNGKRALLIEPGTQQGGWEVAACVEFESAGLQYTFFAPDVSAEWVGKLQAAAASMQ